jgi:hypothetical protein
MLTAQVNVHDDVQDNVHPTHMINAIGGRGFYLGTLDERTYKLAVRGETSLVESLDSPANWFVAGTAQDGRILHVGMIAPAVPSYFESCYNWVPARGDVCTVTSVRSLTYDPLAARLVALPVNEYKTLRNGSLCELKRYTVQRGEHKPLPVPAGRGAEMDMEMSIALPTPAAAPRVPARHDDAPPPQLTFGIDLLASPTNLSRATRLALNVSHARADGSRLGNLTLMGSRLSPTGQAGLAVRAGWLIRPNETVLELRILVDRSIIEVFAAGGRAVATARDYPDADEVNARVWVEAPMGPGISGGGGGLMFESIAAWSMGCGWEDAQHA